MTNKLVPRLVPAIFLLLWASGFVVARLVRPYSEPFSFVTLRFIISAGLLGVIALLGQAHWPRTLRGWTDNLITGALMQGFYVGGIFWAIKHGLPPAISALIAGLQPLVTGVLATPLLGERVSAKRWMGIATGFAGAVLVIAPHITGTDALPPLVVGAALASTGGITFGTIWQKRTGGASDLRCGASIQAVGALMVTAPLMLLTEHGHIGANVDVWIALAWGVVVLSIVTTLLLLWLIKGGEVAGVVSLFYLVPPITALMAFTCFGDGLVPIQFFGMAVATVGVAIANRG